MAAFSCLQRHPITNPAMVVPCHVSTRFRVVVYMYSNEQDHPWHTFTPTMPASRLGLNGRRRLAGDLEPRALRLLREWPSSAVMTSGQFGAGPAERAPARHRPAGVTSGPWTKLPARRRGCRCRSVTVCSACSSATARPGTSTLHAAVDQRPGPTERPRLLRRGQRGPEAGTLVSTAASTWPPNRSTNRRERPRFSQRRVHGDHPPRVHAPEVRSPPHRGQAVRASCDFALIAMFRLLRFRIFEATGADIPDLATTRAHPHHRPSYDQGASAHARPPSSQPCSTRG